MPDAYRPPALPTSGTREMYLILREAGGASQRFPCLGLSVPMPSDPTVAEDFIEGALVGVRKMQDTIPGGKIELNVQAFSDPTEITMDNILAALRLYVRTGSGGTGPASTWRPINDALVDTRVHADLPVLWGEFHIDATKMGGKHTVRTAPIYIVPPSTMDRADPIKVSYDFKVYSVSQMTDTVVS